MTIREGTRRPNVWTCTLCLLKTGCFGTRTLRYTPHITLQGHYEVGYEGWHKIAGRTWDLLTFNARDGSTRWVHRGMGSYVEIGIMTEDADGFILPSPQDETTDVLRAGHTTELPLCGTGWPTLPWVAKRPALHDYSYTIQ